jgi:HAD superfamily hydrolase (TIGR01509 family)
MFFFDLRQETNFLERFKLQTKTNFKAIIFDLDGTLIDSMSLWRDLDIKFLAKRGIELPDDIFDNMHSNNLTDTAIYFKERFSLSENISEIMDEWLNSVQQAYASEIQLKSGARELLTSLFKRGITLAIGTSNTRELTNAVLRHHGIYDMFKTIVSGCDTSLGKPNPDIFLLCAENLGISPTNILVIEDTLLGVRAAKNAGMCVYVVADDFSLKDKPEIISLADSYFDDLVSMRSDLEKNPI